MKPHERKGNPPRREPGSEAEEGGNPLVEGYEETVAEDYPGVYPEEAAYDPGAALIDENQSYGTAEEAYYDPNQTYTEPTEAGYAYEEPAVAPPPVYGGSGVYDDAPPMAPVPSRSAAPKKKAAHRAPQRRPVAGHNAPAVRRPAPKPVYGGGISVMTVFLTLVALGMVAVVVMVVLPKDMSAVGGYAANPIATVSPRNLLTEAQKVMIDRTTEIAFSEEDLNRYLNHRLAGEQKGPMAALVKFRGVYVDLSAGKAEVVIERELFGMPMTLSVDLTAESFRRQVIYKPAAWHIGRISLGGRTVKPVVDLFIRLRGSLVDEFHTLQQMSDVRFEDNRVVLDPKI